MQDARLRPVPIRSLLAFSRPLERGALDAITDRIRLGSMVSPVTFRHPAELAKSVVIVDHTSRGRVELGMGAGSKWNVARSGSRSLPRANGWTS
jgi:alkanesulfonate monooxygenase SsuD/methylene tetrahydromethanopterin reductase-like flavin-dependent oxidoreductase (luciferase family)